MNKKRLLFVFIVLALTLSIFFVFSKTKRQLKSTKLININFRLQWHIQTQFAGYFVALKKGFYKQNGLKVNINQGGYGKNNILTVLNGIDDFGTKWPADLIASKKPLISLANIVKDNGLILISKKEKGIDDIQKFKGKRLSIWFIGNEFQLFALLDKNNIKKTELKIIPQKWDMSQFYNDKTDISSAMIYNEFLSVQKKGYSKDKLNIFKFKDFGAKFPGQDIFTSIDFYKKHPDICKKFIEASLKGWKYAINHPKEATKIVMSFDKPHILDYDIQLKQMKEIIKLIQPKKYKLGIHLKKDYDFIFKTFKKYNIIQSTVKEKYFYTNKFILKEK